MPKETDRLKLPLPLGNENVTRESINGIFEKIDAGVATKADLDALREAVSKMDIPDASLTQKGKVQLSSKTDGTSEAVAATEKAVRDARVVAETNSTNNSKSYTDSQVNQISNSLNLFSAAVRSIDNIFVCAFNRSLVVNNGLSFKIQFNTTNSSVNIPTYLQINGTNYQLRVEQFKNYTLPNNLIDTSKIYEVKYNSSLGVFLLMDSYSDADLRSSEITIIVGKSDANAQFTTIQSAVDYLKKFNAGRRSIRIKNTSNSVNFIENVNVRDFHGGPLFFLFDPGIKLNGYFSINDCSAEVFINGNYEKPLEIVNSNGGFSAQSCYKLTLYFVNKVSAGVSFITATGVSSVYVSSCVCSNQYIPFEFNRGCFTYLENVSGTGNDRAGRAEGSLLTLKNFTLSNSTFTLSGGAQLFK